MTQDRAISTAATMVVLALALTTAARADDSLCQEVRDASYQYCNHANDTRRGDCAHHCEHCGEQATACVGYCEHHCDAPYYEGCGFDLNGCTTRCAHRCHDPECQDNAACKAFWCNKENIKTCGDGCQATFAALAGCRATWCENGRAKRACLDGCTANQKTVQSCRHAWCGDGAAAKRCYQDADEAEKQCRELVDTELKTCLASQAKPAAKK